MDYSAVFWKFECEHKMFEVIKCILLTFGLIISFQMGCESIARRGQIPPCPPLLSMHPRPSSTCLGRVQWLDDDTSQMVQEKLDYLLHFTLSHPPAMLSNRNPEWVFMQWLGNSFTTEAWNWGHWVLLPKWLPHASVIKIPCFPIPLQTERLRQVAEEVKCVLPHPTRYVTCSMYSCLKGWCITLFTDVTLCTFCALHWAMLAMACLTCLTDASCHSSHCAFCGPDC